MYSHRHRTAVDILLFCAKSEEPCKNRKIWMDLLRSPCYTDIKDLNCHILPYFSEECDLPNWLPMTNKGFIWSLWSVCTKECAIHQSLNIIPYSWVVDVQGQMSFFTFFIVPLMVLKIKGPWKKSLMTIILIYSPFCSN